MNLSIRFTGKSVSAVPARDGLMRADYFVAVMLTLLALYLHGVFLVNAGGLWRDEANSISLALKPTLTDVWSALKFDSFPVLHILIARFWAELFSASDMSLRVLGFIVGISIIAAFWFKAHELGTRPPLLSLLLIGVSPVMTRSLDSIRPYGLAVLTTIVAFTVVWRTVQKPSAVRLMLASFCLVLCVQTLFQSTFFVFAIGLGAFFVGFLRGGLKQVFLLAVPFCVAGFSLLPYGRQLREAQNWLPLARNPLVGVELLTPALRALRDAISSPTQWFMWLWAIVAAFAVVGVIRSLVRKRIAELRTEAERHVLLYCAITSVVSLVCFLPFLIYVHVSLQVWHYVPVLVMVVVSAEPLVEQLIPKRFPRGLYLFVIAGSALLATTSGARNLTMRMTSVDLAASVIQQEARSGDLVIVSPSFFGVSFLRYYRGSAPWMTFPALRDTSIHRYDLLKERMQQPEAIAEDISRISSTLAMGGRVWVVGHPYAIKPGLPVAPLPPAPLPLTGWSIRPYLLNWSQQLMSTLSLHTRQSQTVAVHSERTVNPLESPNVTLFEGWVP